MSAESAESVEHGMRALLGGSPLLLVLFPGASPRELLRERPTGLAIETRWSALRATLDNLARKGADEQRRAIAAQSELDARRVRLAAAAGQPADGPLRALGAVLLEELHAAQRQAFRQHLQLLAPSGTLSGQTRQIAARHAEGLGLEPNDVDRTISELKLADEPALAGALPPAPLLGSPVTLEDAARALINDPAVTRDVLVQGHFARWLASWGAPEPLRIASDRAATVAHDDPLLAAHTAAWSLGSNEVRVGATLYADAADLGRDVLSDRVTAEVIESMPSCAALQEWLVRQGRPSAAEAVQRVAAREGHGAERLRWAFGAPYTLGEARFTDVASLFAASVADPGREPLLSADFRSGRLLAWFESLSATARSESWVTLLRAARDRADGDETPLWQIAFEAASIRGLRVTSPPGIPDVIDDPRSLLDTREVARRWDGLKETLRTGKLRAWLALNGQSAAVEKIDRRSASPDCELNRLLWALGMPGVVIEWGTTDRPILAPHDLCALFLEDPERFDHEARKGYLLEWLATAHADAVALPGSTRFGTLGAAARLVDRRWRGANAPTGHVGLALAILCGQRALPRDPRRPGPRTDQLGSDGGLIAVRHGRSTRDDWAAADAHVAPGTLGLWIAAQGNLSPASKALIDQVLAGELPPDALFASLRPVEPRGFGPAWLVIPTLLLLALAAVAGAGFDRASGRAPRGVAAPARAPERCPEGRADCDHDPRSGCETYVRDDPNHCGTCDVRCPASPPHTRATCEGGRCALQCSPGWIACDGVRDDANGCEANPNESAAHCGGCDQACPEAPGRVAVCTAGTCGLACGVGRMDCNGRERDGCETNVHESAEHCGGCATRCPAMAPNTLPACHEGACVVGACVAGFVEVDGYHENGCEYRCVPRPGRDLPDDRQVDSDCDGVDGEAAAAFFVASDGDDRAAGSRYAPMRSVSAAIERAAREGRTQVLVSAGMYSETLTLHAGVSVYGGYERARGWRRSASAVPIIEGTSAVQGVIAAATGRAISSRTVLDQVTLRTVDAPRGSGASTYALWCVECPGLVVRRSTLVAGAAGDGAAGADGTPGAVGGPGASGATGSGDDNGPGGAGGEGGRSVCGPAGGAGGSGGAAGVNNGAAGQPSNEAPGGTGGRGGDPGMRGVPGQNGRSGLRGRSGRSGLLARLEDTVWRSASGEDGADGSNGVSGGGGGGGGGQGCAVFCDDGRGNGGGGGGGAGCHGVGARGGSAGGDSFAAFLLRSAGATLSQCQLRAGNGGRGGDGGSGGRGGDGGPGGSGGQADPNEVGAGGNGGNGGRGGDGGHGGAGMGGSSIALFTLDGVVRVEGGRLSIGVAGAGGRSVVGLAADGVASPTNHPSGAGARPTPTLAEGITRLSAEDYVGALNILRRLRASRSPLAPRLQQFIEGHGRTRIDALILGGQCPAAQSLSQAMLAASLTVDRGLFGGACPTPF